MNRSALLRLIAAGLVLIATGSPGAKANRAPPLEAHVADIKESSISGLSSGAFMAIQFATAWSSVIKGVGAIAGGPYYCAQGQAVDIVFGFGGLLRARGPCMQSEPPLTVRPSITAADRFAVAGDIDALANLRFQKVYLFNGYNDAVVAPGVGGVTRAFYHHYLAPDRFGNVFHQDTIGAGHAVVTVGAGGACSANGGDYINQCQYDQAGILLQHIYGRLRDPAARADPGRLKPFDQAEFTRPFRPVDHSLSDTGYVYVPAACGQQPCRVHIALHGCLQTADMIGDRFITQAGYNEWAETNNLIVLYPQTRPSPILPYNPRACWDWWGYTNPLYATRNPVSRQIGVIKAMLDRVAAKGGPQPAAPGAGDSTPAGLTATDRSATAIALAWFPVAGARVYTVYRSVDGATFTRAGQVEGPSFADAGLQPRTTYIYQVAAVFESGEGPVSTVVRQATRAVPPRCGTPGTCPVVP